MTDSVTSEFRKDYEERSIVMLRNTLFACFGISVCEPDAGFTRVFNRRNLGCPWPTNLNEPVQIDFFAHTDDVKSIPSGHFSHADNRYVTESVSINTNTDTSAPITTTPASMSPEKADPSLPASASATVVQGKKYIIGEITYGGRIAVISKLAQLERDCEICKLKLSTTNVLNAVVVAVVVSKDDFIKAVFDEISRSPHAYPNIFIIYDAGRFIYIKYSETSSERMNSLAEGLNDATNNILTVQTEVQTMASNFETNLEQLRNDMAHNASNFETNLEQLRNDIAGINSKIEAILSILNSINKR